MTCDRFIILSSRRVGSTALSLMIDKSEHVDCSGEMIFLGKHHPAIMPKHVAVNENTDVYDLLTPKLGLKKGIKFTIPEYQASEMDVITKLIKNKNLHVVHLTRSLLEQFVSLKVAKKSDIWHIATNSNCQSVQWVEAKKAQSGDNTFATDIDEINDFCTHVIAVDRAIKQLADYNPYFRIDHADMSSPLILKKLASFLEIKRIKLTDIGLGTTTKFHQTYLQQIDGAFERFNYFEALRDHD